MSWRLTLREKPPCAIDVSALLPAAIAGKSSDEVEALPVFVGTQRTAAGECFRLTRTEQAALEFDGETTYLDRVATRMTEGAVVVHGSCGQQAGFSMRRGALTIMGSAGDGLAMGLRGGAVEVSGSAAKDLGGPAPGDRHGMRGGRVLVRGNAGDRCGAFMRRGEVLIGGDVGAFCAAQMLAGTIAVIGNTAAEVGLGMKRGTLLVGEWPHIAPAGFVETGRSSSLWLALLVRSWRTLPAPWSGIDASVLAAQNWRGDRRYGGLGELIVWPSLML